MIEKNIISLLAISIFPIFTATVYAQTKVEKATFAGGCFWCMTPPFEKLDGVISVVSGYTGGTGENPTYQDYAEKGHIEAVQVTYEPSKIKYTELLNVFWRQIDPTDPIGQFCDKGPQYRSAIFYHNAEQKQSAERSKESLGKLGRFQKPIVTEIIPAVTFYPAEEYHQDYHKKNRVKYEFYRFSCGRDQYLKKVWGAGNKPGKVELKKRLTPMQYKVTQENGTEPAFNNEYWNNHKEGIYVDVVSGEPLFSSTDKFESGTGWPSFTKPLEPGNIVEKVDNSFFMKRTEIRSAHGETHLGHLFNDGPAPAGLRYCMNSAALRFVPKENLEKEGYPEYKKLFEKKP